MSKIEEILKKDEHTPIERCLVNIYSEGDILEAEMAEKAAEALVDKDAELSALRARVEALEADNERTREAVKMARQKLRSTQINWQEDCLFDCDSFLNIALDVCPSCTWRGDVSLVDGECPYCKTNWHELRKAA